MLYSDSLIRGCSSIMLSVKGGVGYPEGTINDHSIMAMHGGGIANLAA